MITGIFCILWKLPVSSLVDVWGWKAPRVPLPMVAPRPSSQSCTADAGSPTTWAQEARPSSRSLRAAPGPQVWGPLALLVTPGRHLWQKSTEIDTKPQSPITQSVRDRRDRWTLRALSNLSSSRAVMKLPFHLCFCSHGDGRRGFLGVSRAAAAACEEGWGLSTQ